MSSNSVKVKVMGRRVLVEKEKIDAGAFRLQPETESEGQKNTGIIVGIGQIGLVNKLRGLKVGAKIYFKKHFTSNWDSNNQLVFVDTDSIVGIIT